MLNDDGELFPQKLYASERQALRAWCLDDLNCLRDIDDVLYVLETLDGDPLFEPDGEEPIHDLLHRCRKIHDYWKEHR